MMDTSNDITAGDTAHETETSGEFFSLRRTTGTPGVTTFTYPGGPPTDTVTITSTAVKNCGHCGRKLKRKWSFCPGCGASKWVFVSPYIVPSYPVYPTPYGPPSQWPGLPMTWC